MTEQEGRHCPIHYRYQPEVLCRYPEPVCEEVLYIVGGLYGNPYALDAIEAMAAGEASAGRKVRLVFNGDFNWFNASNELFRSINERVLRHTASLGNVEYELAHPTEGAGCGCAYPDSVDQAVVERSNAIMKRLQSLASQHPDIQKKLSGLPRFRCLMFGGLKVLVLHGDPESLAGWGLSLEMFHRDGGRRVRDWFQRTGADMMVCTHTCLPVLWADSVSGAARVVANNGSAGMGNLAGDPRGLVTRIARDRPAAESPNAVNCGETWVSLEPVDFNARHWLEEFDQLWPAGSDAALSYRNRILYGTSLTADSFRFPRWY